MVGANHAVRKNRAASNFSAGATSGMLTTFMLQPLDVAKTRMQLSSAFGRSIGIGLPHQMTLHIPENSGVLTTLRYIIINDGVRGLWRGTFPSAMRNMAGVGLYFVSLNQLSWLLSSADGTVGAWGTLIAGAASRSISATLLCPLSVVKTRFEAKELASRYRGLFDALVTIARKERLRGLFSGLVPTILRDAPYSALYVLIYLRTKDGLIQVAKLQDAREARSAGQAGPVVSGWQSMSINFTAGFFGGGLATFLTQPQDVVKTRMQLARHSIGKRDKYASVSETIRRIFKEEGLYGFFRGSTPRFAKRCLGSAITWMVYEETVNFYEKIFEEREKRILRNHEQKEPKRHDGQAATAPQAPSPRHP